MSTVDRDSKSKSKRCVESNFSFIRYMSRFDLFAQDVPNFNVKGKQSVPSSLGSALTLIAGAIILIYASVKAIHVQSVLG